MHTISCHSPICKPRPDLSCASQVLHHLGHLGPASQKLTHQLISQACLQTSPIALVVNPPWGGAEAFSPAGKGELLMACVMAMAQPSQHSQGAATLLNSLLTAYGLSPAAQTAIAKVHSHLPATASHVHLCAEAHVMVASVWLWVFLCNCLSPCLTSFLTPVL